MQDERTILTDVLNNVVCLRSYFGKVWIVETGDHPASKLEDSIHIGGHIHQHTEQGNDGSNGNSRVASD